MSMLENNENLPSVKVFHLLRHFPTGEPPGVWPPTASACLPFQWESAYEYLSGGVQCRETLEGTQTTDTAPLYTSIFFSLITGLTLCQTRGLPFYSSKIKHRPSQILCIIYPDQPKGRLYGPSIFLFLLWIICLLLYHSCLAEPHTLSCPQRHRKLNGMMKKAQLSANTAATLC